MYTSFVLAYISLILFMLGQFSQHGGVQAIRDAILNTEDITLQVCWFLADLSLLTVGAAFLSSYLLFVSACRN